MNRVGPVMAAMILSACSPCVSGGASDRDWHRDKRAVDRAVGEAVDAGDYDRAIALLGKSGRPRSVIDLQVGDLIVAGHRDPDPKRRPAYPVGDGLALLERASTGHGEGAREAPQHLRLWFERGVASVMAPRPALAACWLRVEQATQSPHRCIALRRA